MRFLPKLNKPAISLGKNVLAPLGLNAAMSATDVAIQKNIYGGGNSKNSSTKTVKFSNEDLNDMTKIVKALEHSDVLMEGVTKLLKSDIKRGSALRIIPMLLGTLGASLLTGRGMYRASFGNKCKCGQGMYRAGSKGKGLFRAGQGIKRKSLMPPHPLTNLEIIDYFKNEPRFNGVYSRNNLPKIKKGAYVINLDRSKNTGTHWVDLL